MNDSSQPSAAGEQTPAVPKRENPLRVILWNVVVPTLILMKLSRPDRLGPLWALVLALIFPLANGIHGFWQSRKIGFIPALGFVSVLLTGGLSLFKISAQWMAVKEAAVPSVIGLAILGSMWTRFPLVRSILFNDAIMDVKLVTEALRRHGHELSFERLLKRTSVLLASSFFLSATLNYILAKTFLVSEVGSAAYNEELGRMHLWAYPVIVVPCMLVMMGSLWLLLNGLKKLTGCTVEEMLRLPQEAKKSDASPS